MVYCIQAGSFACSGFPEIPFWKQYFNMPLTVFSPPGLKPCHSLATLHDKEKKKRISFTLNVFGINSFCALKSFISSIKSMKKYSRCKKHSTINFWKINQTVTNIIFFQDKLLGYNYLERSLFFMYTMNIRKIKSY